MGELVNDNETVWSHSRIACFCQCKYEFYLKYILKDKLLYPPIDNYYAEVGVFVHDILAQIFQGKLTTEEALAYYSKNYDDSIKNPTKDSIMFNNFMKIADYFADLDLTNLKNYDIIGVELEERFKVGNNNFVGYIDLLLRDKADGKLILIDHKSSAYPFTKKGTVKKAEINHFETYKRQMYLYSHAIYQQFGEFPKEIVWNHFKDGGQLAVIPFKKEEYDEIIAWFEKTIEEITAEEAFEEHEDFFYCHNLCNFRRCCEYKNMKGE